MLLPGFYKVLEAEWNALQLNAVVELNAEHEIFKGHFPNDPVTPGVCMLQLLKELTEQGVGKKLFIKECSNVKFMALINPEIHAVLNVNIVVAENESGYKIKASAGFDETTALKVSALLSENL